MREREREVGGRKRENERKGERIREGYERDMTRPRRRAGEVGGITGELK